MSKNDLSLPWTYDGNDHYSDSGGRYRNILDANENEVTGEYSNVSHEEAEFIVRAVNSHDSLVAMIEEMIEGYSMGRCKKARALLASLADGQNP